MNRILFEPEELDASGRVSFGGVRAVHVMEVLHGSVGQVLKTGVVNGKIGTSVIEDIVGEGEQVRITVRCTHEVESLPPWCDLVLAMPRPRVFKRLLPQLVTMGVGKIVLVGAEKVEKCYWSADCLTDATARPLMVEGLMQAGTSILPTLRIEKNFKRYVETRLEEEFGASPRRFLAHPDAVANGPVAAADGASRSLVAIGPEGGWTDDELALLERHAFRRLSLGPRILKTETAAIALLATIQAR